MIEIVTIDTPSLGDRTYLATDGAGALVVDPQRGLAKLQVSEFLSIETGLFQQPPNRLR